MTLRLLLLLVVLSLTASAQIVPGPSGPATAPGSTITGQIQTAAGGVITNGTLTFNLSQPAIVSGVATIAASQVSCYTSTGGNVVGVPDPIVLPVTAANLSSGTLAAGNYYVETYYIGSGGLSVVSPEAVVALSVQGTILVNPPVLQPAGATGYGVAIGTSSGGETVQGTVTGWTQFSQSTPLIVGSTPPSINTSTCALYFSDALVPTGTYYTVNLINKNGSKISGYPQTWCTYGGLTGTINVSAGAPTGNCNTNGVFYPTPIMSLPGGSQSIGVGSLSPMNGNTSQGLGTSTALWNAYLLAVVASSLNAEPYTGTFLYPTIGQALLTGVP